jgi:two-component system chemotaxis response regulator CheY
MKVMVVDDCPYTREILRIFLERLGCEIIEAEDGDVAIEKYIAHNPDIVAMDHLMPKMKGIEAVKEILKIDSKAKIVMVTSMGAQEYMVSDGIRIGVKDFLPKPFTEKDVKTVFSRYLDLSKVGNANLKIGECTCE